ncbi:MAG: hypothetical protein FJ148_08535 [Deltaproteobacteria bacterium]|nr:hypothetical protein [Deltaproteobacteria bacterium]
MTHSKRISFLLAVLAMLGTAGRAGAIPLNEEGTINLNVRAYVNARIGTVAKQSTRPGNQPPACVAQPNADNCNFGGTFPYSGAGNLIQNRYFLELRWNHDLLDWWSDVLPKNVTAFKYNLSYRGEYEGIYDFGPSAYKNNLESRQEIEQALRQGGYSLESTTFRLQRTRNRLRNVASYRNRLFQAFIDWEQGPVFVRFGRQNLVWGETDVFRLLDNINPTDSSFGGFFIDLDERRVPLNMLRVSYNIGSLGPVDQAFIEAYAAMDNTVAGIPGAPTGSPWAIPLGPPTGSTLSILEAPAVSVHNTRGGGRFVFNAADMTFTLASYQTMFDIPAVRFQRADPSDNGFVQGISAITAVQTYPLVWVNGASMTTALPSLQSVLRTEVAYFKDEALYVGPVAALFPGKGVTTQFATDFLGPVSAGQLSTVRRQDTFNMAIGWDSNQFIRFLNPNQSFFFSTQFFYRHIFDYKFSCTPGDCVGQALPVPEPNNSTRTIPLVQDTFLHTLAINTTYNVKAPFTDNNVQVTPGFNMFYDWQGMLVFQPGIRFVRDPWRFIVDYTAINSGVYRYQIGLVRDKANVRMQLEFVL